MRIGGRRHGVGRRWRPALHRRPAVVVAAVLALTVAAPQQSLARSGQDPLPLSWLWSWFDLPAGWASPSVPGGPVQESAGGAAGKSHTARLTRAGGGAGHPRGRGAGELDPYSPHKVPVPAASTTGHVPDDHSLDPARSTRIGADSTATSDVYQNPDGSFTRHVYSGPRNFKAADGMWTPIDTTVAQQSDGRWHERANAVGVDFAG